MNQFRIIAGAVIWVVVIALSLFGLRRWNSDQRTTVTKEIAQYVTGKRTLIKLQFDSEQSMRMGDPIFMFEGDKAIRIGEIARVGSMDSTEMEVATSDIAYAYFYARSPRIDANDTLDFHSTPTDMGWVIKMMLPPEKRKKISGLITEAFVDHQTEIINAFRPVIENALREALPLIEDDLREAIEKRQDRFAKIGNRYREEIVKKQLVPLVENEIWPIVRDEAQPVVDEIGREIWGKASLIGFGWRVLYDASPLPKKELTKKEFNRFVKKEALPVIQENMDELIELQEKILSKVANNPKVRKIIGQSIFKIIDDPEVQKLVVEVIEEVFVKNPRLVSLFEKHWQGEQARAAMMIANDRLEPCITGIGEELFGNPEVEITPEFSRVLRYKILKKDQRWLVWNPANIRSNSEKMASEIKVNSKVAGTQNPFHVRRPK